MVASARSTAATFSAGRRGHRAALGLGADLEREARPPGGLHDGHDAVGAHDGELHGRLHLVGCGPGAHRRDHPVEPGARAPRHEDHGAGARPPGVARARKSARPDPPSSAVEAERASTSSACTGLRVGVVAVGPEDPLRPERSGVDGDASGARGGFVASARDEVRDGLPGGRDGPLGGAHHELTGAGEDLPEHELDGIARRVVWRRSTRSPSGGPAGLEIS